MGLHDTHHIGKVLINPHDPDVVYVAALGHFWTRNEAVAGIERVVLPERNRRDVEEITSTLLDGLDLQFVGTIDEALRYTLSEPLKN